MHAWHSFRLGLPLATPAHPLLCLCCLPQTESLRASRQYGSVVSVSELPCSALGARADLAAVIAEAGFLMPTNTFSGRASFTVRSRKLET